MSRETDDALRQAIAASLADQASQDADDDLRQALRDELEHAEEQLRAALARGAPEAAVRAGLSLVLADAGDAAGAAAERDRAMAAGADDASAAFEALEGLRGGGGT